MSAHRHIEHGMDNVFGIEGGEKCFCYLAYFRWDHPFLRIIVSGGKDKRGYLDFSGHVYFEGDTAWVGANFRTASKDERDRFIEKIGRKVENIPEYTYLYLADKYYPDKQHYTTQKILAYHAGYQPQTRTYEYSYEDKLLERIKPALKTGEPSIYSTEVIDTARGQKELKYRTSLTTIFERLEAGDTQADILELYPWLEPQDIQAALIYARRAISKPSDKPTE